MKSSWTHLNLWFRNGEELSEAQNRSVRKYLQRVVSQLQSRRYFYLYEPTPHLFLAVENISPERLAKASHPAPKFISRITVERPGTDETNPSWWVDAMCAVAKGLVEADALKPMGDRPYEGFTKFNHLIHCLMDMRHGSRDAERITYFQHLEWYKRIPTR